MNRAGGLSCPLLGRFGAPEAATRGRALIAGCAPRLAAAVLAARDCSPAS